MTIEEVIKKAIEGGYKAYPKPFCQECGNYVPMESKNRNIFLDPLFWQALGKAMGWGKKTYDQNRICLHCRFSVDRAGDYDICNHVHYPEGCKKCENSYQNWEWHWHSFIDHLARGKTIEEFFNQF